MPTVPPSTRQITTGAESGETSHSGSIPTHKHTTLLRLARVQEFELVEISQLARLVLKRMNDEESADGEKNEAWVGSQFHYPLRSWLIKANWNSVTFVGLSMVVVGGGFATSGISVAAKGSAASWVIFGIGLLVALVGGISQQFRFGVRANERRALAASLRGEGWRYVFKVGDYARQDASAVFRAKVEELQHHAAQLAVIDGDRGRAPNPSAPPKANGISPQDPDEPAPAEEPEATGGKPEPHG